MVVNNVNKNLIIKILYYKMIFNILNRLNKLSYFVINV